MAYKFKTEELQRLDDAVRWSKERLAHHRSACTAFVNRVAGRHFVNDSHMPRTPLNYLELAFSIYASLLVQESIQVATSTTRRQLRMNSEKLELSLNNLLKEIRFSETLERIVTDAFTFPFGICKTGLNASKTVEIGGVTHDVGQPFADDVASDDFVMDMATKKTDALQYIGDEYDIVRMDAEKSGLYDMDVLDLVSDHEDMFENDDGRPRKERISRGQGSVVEFLPSIRLRDLWLPHYGCVITVPVDLPHLVCRSIEWNGPETGPYDLLGYTYISGQILKLPPAALLTDLHDLANRMARKVANQAERQKTIGTFSSNDAEAAENIRKASDGDVVKVDGQGINEAVLGGIDPRNMAVLLQSGQWFSYFAGNLDLLGGLSPQSGTATQDQLLSASASKRIQKMQVKVLSFVTSVVRKLAWYLWYDPVIEMPLTKRIPGPVDIEIPMNFTPEDRDGDILDYNIEISPYSMLPMPPGMKAGALMELMQTLAPLAPLLAQQGLALNLEAFIKLLAKYRHMEADFGELVKVIGDQSGAGLTDQQVVSPRGGTHSVYERVNRPSATTGGKANAMITTMLGGNVQKNEMDSLFRQTG